MTDLASSIAGFLNKYSIYIALLIVFGYLIYFFSQLFIKIKERREKDKAKRLKKEEKEKNGDKNVRKEEEGVTNTATEPTI